MAVSGWKNTRGRNSPPRRATLSAIGPAAIVAPASAPRTAGGESQTCHHCPATEDSIAGTDSFRLSSGADSDPASFSQQVSTVDLQRIGTGNPRQRGISLRQRPTAGAQKQATIRGKQNRWRTRTRNQRACGSWSVTRPSVVRTSTALETARDPRGVVCHQSDPAHRCLAFLVSEARLGVGFQCLLESIDTALS